MTVNELGKSIGRWKSGLYKPFQHWRLKGKANLISYFLIPSLIILCSQLFYVVCNKRYSYAISIPGYIFQQLLFLSLYLLIFSLWPRVKNAAIISSVLIFTALIVNQLKIIFSDEPIFISDIFLLSDAGEIGGLIKDNLFSSILPYIIPVLVYFLMLVLIIKVGKNQRPTVASKTNRALIALLSIGFLVVPLINRVEIKDTVLRVFFETESRGSNYSRTNIQYYYRYGFLSGLYGQVLENRMSEPQGYSHEEVQMVLGRNGVSDSTDSWGKPNIIMVFSESFFDVSLMEDISFTKPVTSNFNALKEEGVVFEMLSPSYGGISANVEYEVLTSSNTEFFGKNYIPYTQLYRSSKYSEVPSAIKELNSNGYLTKIVSTWGPELFSCARVYEYMGAEEMIFREDMKEAELKGGRISEKYVADSIISEFNQKKKGQPEFYMVLTAQAHMPYNYDKYESYDIAIESSPYSQEINKTLLSYAQGVYDADAQLGRLYEYIQTLDEPTLLVFYGDHLPFLKTEDGEDATEVLSYFNTGSEKNDEYRKYNTQGLILSNFSMEQESRYLSPDLIMPYIFDKTSIKTSEYYSYLVGTMDILPSFNHTLATNSQGEIYYIEELPDNMKKTLVERQQVNWKYFNLD